MDDSEPSVAETLRQALNGHARSMDQLIERMSAAADAQQHRSELERIREAHEQAMRRLSDDKRDLDEGAAEGLTRLVDDIGEQLQKLVDSVCDD